MQSSSRRSWPKTKLVQSFVRICMLRPNSASFLSSRLSNRSSSTTLTSATLRKLTLHVALGLTQSLVARSSASGSYATTLRTIFRRHSQRELSLIFSTPCPSLGSRQYIFPSACSTKCARSYPSHQSTSSFHQRCSSYSLHSILSASASPPANLCNSQGAVVDNPAVNTDAARRTAPGWLPLR